MFAITVLLKMRYIDVVYSAKQGYDVIQTGKHLHEEKWIDYFLFFNGYVGCH